MIKDILRAAVAVPPLKVADVAFNTAEIEKTISRAAAEGATVLTLPELCLTGYTCGDLFLSELLLRRAEEALCLLAAATPASLLVAVGAPLSVAGQLYNCAVLLHDGRIVGAVPKTYLPDYGEYCETRYFSSGADLPTTLATLGCYTFPVGTDLVFRAPDGVTVAAELCEDLWAPIPPSTLLAMGGAQVILNLSACNEVAGKRARRKNLVLQQSARTHTAYLYVSAGTDESSADVIYSGHGIIALGGRAVAENSRVVDRDYLLTADLDLGRILYDRRHNRTFATAAARYGVGELETVSLSRPLALSDGKLLQVNRLPFVPTKKESRARSAMDIFEMQTAALARRLSVVGGKLTVGVSGGLDSTLALLVAAHAMDQLGLPRTNIIAITMPCFGTTEHTLQSANALMEGLGVDARTISIREAVLQHFRDIGQDEKDYSVTYENSQARERTQVLMDVANREGAIVLGTGDLSEAALGWCTYNGDHMSMYAVNSGVPKTLIRFIIESVVEAGLFPAVKEALGRVLDTPISPELLPPDAVGNIAQKTEDLVGPYALHDFFLYYAVRYQYSPAKIFDLATIAFDGTFDRATVKKWLAVFFGRFFTQQFKRNCTPDGVKIGSVGLSPRGDFKMPSDAVCAEWLREIEEIEL